MTNTPTPDQLTEVVRDRRPADCIAFLAKYDAATRHRLGHAAVALFAEDIEAHFKSPSPATLRTPDAARVAVLATGSLEQVISCDWHIIPEPELLIEVFDTFQPDWADEWVKHELDQNPYIMRYLHWLWEVGLCSRPRSDSFFHGLIVTPVFLHWPVENSALRGKPAMEDPRLVTTPVKQAELVDDLWRLFEVKGRGEFSLGYLDHGFAWRRDFIELCEAGHMPREHLMDASLAALSRDFNQPEARFFARLYTDLKPTAEEQSARCDTLLALLASEMPSTVSFAVKAVKKVNENYPIPAADLIKALEPVFLSPGKGTIIAAISLAKDAVRRAPDTRQAALAAIVQGLHHESDDVQEASLKVLEDWQIDTSPEALQTLQDSVNVLPPSLKTRVLALCGAIGISADESVR
ncbi:MAG: DUF6493 family protein [Pseudomonadota bacterium]